MPRPVPVLVQTYRGRRLFVLDDGGPGWSVLVEGKGADPVLTLSDERTAALPQLVAAAREHVDHVLDHVAAEGA